MATFFHENRQAVGMLNLFERKKKTKAGTPGGRRDDTCDHDVLSRTSLTTKKKNGLEMKPATKKKIYIYDITIV